MLQKPKTIRQVYLDHAATTYMDKKVVEAMMPFFIDNFGNPSSLYNIGRQANGALNDARREVAQLISALPDNIIFTAGGTESDNLAIYGIAQAHAKQGKHIISLEIEHHAVLHPLEDLQKQGWKVDLIKVNKAGIVNVKDVIKTIRPDTVLISIMYANNEIGSIEPIADIGRAILKYRKRNNSVYPYFHTDACQAAGYLDLNVEKLHVDLMTVNGSKIYGPKGVGMLYVRRGVNLKPLMVGGSQERHLRAGTENVAGIVGFAKAFALAQKNRDKESIRVAKLRDYLYQRIKKEISDVQLNGPDLGNGERGIGNGEKSLAIPPNKRSRGVLVDDTMIDTSRLLRKPPLPELNSGQAFLERIVNRLPNNLNITFKNVEGEAMLLYLDEYGVMCSTGSACTSDSLDPSHVLTAIGLPYEMAHGSLRFSFGKCNTKADVDYLMKYLPKIIATLREMSPVNMNNRRHAKYK